MNVKKGVIVAAGYGSRFLPATKTIPKEMLPLIDKPAISFVVDEFLESGINEILVITSRRKKVLDDYFDREVELEEIFKREGKQEQLNLIQPPRAQIFFVRQQEMKGTGHALLLARPFTGIEPFVVAYPDDIVLAQKPLAAQLIEAFHQCGSSILSVKDLGEEDVSRYGVVAPGGGGNPCPVKQFVEKPPRGEEPSKLVSYGRFLFTKDFYTYLEEGLASHSGGEYYHVKALNQLAGMGQLAALNFEGKRLDTGDPMGFLEASCRYALKRPEWAEKARALFGQLANS